MNMRRFFLLGAGIAIVMGMPVFAGVWIILSALAE